ncbi:MAG TPA: helicase-associated domain-containing protein [Spirochaetia bacterium]|nr:helicase-associated domain-containing protein [Spirochaetia bacterium]
MTTLARWRSSLLTLNDRAFFDIIRNYLGEVKTPFNKHELIGKLESFLVNPENQRRILALIDAEDAQVLVAVDLLEEPTYDMLFAYLGTEMSYVDLHHRLLNLADRLLISRDSEQNTISLNPLFHPMLQTRLLRRDQVFPGVPVGSPETGAMTAELPWLGDALVLALLSYLFTPADLFKTDGSLRKKNEEDLKSVFGELMQQHQDPLRKLDLAMKTLETLGLVTRSETRLIPARPAIDALGGLSSRERHEIYWTAALFGGRDQIEEQLNFLRAFEENLPQGSAYPPRVMEQLCTALFLRTTRKEPPDIKSLVVRLRHLGLLCETESGDFVINPHLSTSFADTGSPGEPAIIVQPTFSVTIKPWLPLASALPVATSAEVRRFDRFPQYTITKASFGRALSAGYEAAEIALTLQALSGKPLPQNVAFSLETWAAEYSSVALYEGVVLIADEKRRFLVEHSQRMKPYIRKRLAPGVFLLDPRERSVWAEILREEGLEMLPYSAIDPSGGVVPAQFLAPFAGVGKRRTPRNLELFSSSEPIEETDSSVLPDAAEIERNLAEALDALDTPQDKRDEIAERIKRKLIVHPSQISRHITRGERLEAKGLDYTGKIRLIEQVLQDQKSEGPRELLEIVRRTPRGAPVRTIMRPAELQKAGTQLILVGNVIPDESEVRIPVSKMVLVRKLKGTLFG